MATEYVEAEGAAAAALLSLYPFAEIQLERYVDILAGRGLDWGLLGPREGGKLWSRHVANSVALVDVIPEGVGVADVGSGAGLPGLPLAIVRPDLRLTLIEPMQRRAEFLALALDELGLNRRVVVHRGRAEDCRRELGGDAFFDVITCRAVAPLVKLLGWTVELFAPDGQLVALKGQSAEQEIQKARGVLKSKQLSAEVLELSPGPGLEGTRAIRCRRV